MKQLIYIFLVLLLQYIPLQAQLREVKDFPIRTDSLFSLSQTQIWKTIYGDDSFEIRQSIYFFQQACNNYNLEKALFYFDKLKQNIRINHDDRLLFISRYMLVRLYNWKGYYDQALQLAENMYQEAKSQNDLYYKNMACISIADVYIMTNRTQEALYMVKTVLPDGNQPLWDSPDQLLALNYMVTLYVMLNDVENSRKYLNYLEAYEKSTSVPVKDKAIMCFIKSYSHFGLNCNYAQYYLTRNLPDSAKIHIQKTEEWVRKWPDTFYQIFLHGLYINYYAAIKNFDKELSELNKMTALAHKHDIISLSVKFMRAKADLLVKTGYNQEASELYSQIIHLKDSIDNENYVHKMGQFNARFKAEKIESENRQLEIRRQTLFWSISSLAILCLILGILFFIIRNLRNKLKMAKKQAEISEHLKSTFLANMNHEIRTPLNAIAGFSELLIEETDPETCHQYSEIIKDSNELLVRLINDVLDISRMEAGTLVLSYTEVSLPELLISIYQTMKLRVEAPVELILDPPLPFVLKTDKDRLTQVLTNFLTNAIKYTSEGSIRFGYKLLSDSTHFYVTDTGKGIPKEEQDVIFTRFIQGKEQKGGVGLGLALCKGFITQMGGEIGVTSQQGKGSTFWFTLYN